jgi:hypothetical protein
MNGKVQIIAVFSAVLLLAVGDLSAQGLKGSSGGGGRGGVGRGSGGGGGRSVASARSAARAAVPALPTEHAEPRRRTRTVEAKRRPPKRQPAIGQPPFTVNRGDATPVQSAQRRHEAHHAAGGNTTFPSHVASGFHTSGCWESG